MREEKGKNLPPATAPPQPAPEAEVTPHAPLPFPALEAPPQHRIPFPLTEPPSPHLVPLLHHLVA